jgi:integrase/recombinase XerD
VAKRGRNVNPRGRGQARHARPALRFLGALPGGIRKATVEAVREALDAITADASESTARQYVLRVKSLLSYAHKLGYMPFNAGVAIKVRPDQSQARLAQRIIEPVDVQLLIRAARSQRDRVLLQVAYAGGLRVSETVALAWADVIARDDKVQLSIAGKGGRVRQVLLPKSVSRSLLALRGDAGANDPVFASCKLGGHLDAHSVHVMVKRTAKRAGINEAVSPHWLRHAHGSHALDRGATLAQVQATLGHANVATTSGYLHARPDSSSGLYLDEGIFR